ncbi:hypothetical protein EZ242_18980 [Ramlibacter rhizophilus]|uniref:Uncharacterized protein n=1 Tax=Ramlibacter rhizophilus TaxID=1781167 RepID=A0A4Z0BDA9_9BURK|nr:hypothetical protein EZ242_18980 [Ramlibacter rhizophilus]
MAERHPQVAGPTPDLPSARAHPREPVNGAIKLSERGVDGTKQVLAGAYIGAGIGVAAGLPLGPLGAAGTGLLGLCLGGLAGRRVAAIRDGSASRAEQQRLDAARADFKALHGLEDLPTTTPREELERVVQLANAQKLDKIANVIQRLRTLREMSMADPIGVGGVGGDDLAQAVARLTVRALDLSMDATHGNPASTLQQLVLEPLTRMAQDGLCNWADRSRALATMAGHMSRRKDVPEDAPRPGRPSPRERIGGVLIECLHRGVPAGAVSPDVQWSFGRAILRALPMPGVCDALLSRLPEGPGRLERLRDCLHEPPIPLTARLLALACELLHAQAQEADPEVRADSYLASMVDLVRRADGFDQEALAEAISEVVMTRDCPAERRVELLLELAALPTWPLGNFAIDMLTAALRRIHAVDAGPAATALTDGFLTRLITRGSPDACPAIELPVLQGLVTGKRRPSSSVIARSLEAQAADLPRNVASQLRDLLRGTELLYQARVYADVAGRLSACEATRSGVLVHGLLSPDEVMRMVDAVADAQPFAGQAQLIVALMQLTQRQTSQAQLEHAVRRMAGLPQFEAGESKADADAEARRLDFSVHALRAFEQAMTHISRADARREARPDQTWWQRAQALRRSDAKATARPAQAHIRFAWLERQNRTTLINQAWEQRQAGGSQGLRQAPPDAVGAGLD